jgi:cyclopropane-fatty-acyl-phospholipid synthase
MDLLDSGWMPDIFIRIALRFVLFLYGTQYSPEQINKVKREFVTDSKLNHLIDVKDANGPYELPTSFFESFLGPMCKYSACYFEEGYSLEEAEQASLQMYCERAGLEDGMTVLDIGCGWGSLTLHIALNYPHCKITALSPSAKQLAYIRNKSALQSLHNIETFQSDVQVFEPTLQFDRVFAVEV